MIPGTSVFARSARQRSSLLIASLITGLIAGIAYRSLVDKAAERDLANYLRSGLHGIGIALAGWTVQVGFASIARSSLGVMLRRLPLFGEVIIRSLVMAFVVIVVGVFLQLVLYLEPFRLYWFTSDWFITTLPWIVAIGVGISVVLGMAAEIGRLIGRPLLASVVLGTYHRPAREQRIVMFLDIAGSTRLAEAMGELRVHDLITRFFFDIDDLIADHGGAVLAYVGDEVIVTWPLTGDPACNGQCIACFLAIMHKMDALADDYRREFQVAPRFRAGLHAGPIGVSECGDSKRQLAYFGDTMNVAARLCEYCKAVDQRLVVSGDLLRRVTIADGLRVADGGQVSLRSRQEQIETHAILTDCTPGLRYAASRLQGCKDGRGEAQ